MVALGACVPQCTANTVLAHAANSTVMTSATTLSMTPLQDLQELLGDLWNTSTKKKRRMKMNKHKLKKRRKKGHMNTKQSRQ
jgi:hypothetical protein